MLLASSAAAYIFMPLESLVYIGKSFVGFESGDEVIYRYSFLFTCSASLPLYITVPSLYKSVGSTKWLAEYANNTGVTFNYVKKPGVPFEAEWKYIVVNGEALYLATGTVDFELHESEETDLVIKILQLAGVSIKDPSIYQVGSAEEAKDVQQEKA